MANYSTLQWNTNTEWNNAQSNSDVRVNGSDLQLYINLQYEWYDTSTYYNNNSHPTTESGLDEFFDSNNSGVTYGGGGQWNRDAIDWGDSSQSMAGGTADAKHSYLPADGFSWRVYGYVKAPESGTYTIGLDSDDAADVHVNGKLTANWYGGHGPSGSWSGGTDQYTGTVSLTKGNWYTFEARMEEGGGGDCLQVGWQKPSDGSISLLPSGNFYSTSGTLTTGKKVA